VVGGADSLEVTPGVKLIDTPRFPAAYRPEAAKGGEFLDLLRGENDLEWTFLSPSATVAPGERTGKFRLGKDQLLTNDKGSSISWEDFAIAAVDELEKPAHVRRQSAPFTDQRMSESRSAASQDICLTAGRFRRPSASRPPPPKSNSVVHVGSGEVLADVDQTSPAFLRRAVGQTIAHIQPAPPGAKLLPCGDGVRDGLRRVVTHLDAKPRNRVQHNQMRLRRRQILLANNRKDSLEDIEASRKSARGDNSLGELSPTGLLQNDRNERGRLDHERLAHASSPHSRSKNALSAFLPVRAARRTRS
jgi:hypothetical protein